MRHVNKTVISASDASNQNGEQIDANQLISASFHAFFGDSTVDGTFKLQASNDITPAGYMASQDGFTVTNWVDIPTKTIAVTAGASALLTIEYVCYRWIRAVFTDSSGGTSTITVNFEGLST